MTYRTIITRNRTLEGNIEPDKCGKRVGSNLIASFLNNKKIIMGKI